MNEYNTDYQKICNPPKLGLVLVPGLRNIYESSRLCKVIRGNLNVISSKNNNEKIGELLKSSATCQKGINKICNTYVSYLIFKQFL